MEVARPTLGSNPTYFGRAPVLCQNPCRIKSSRESWNPDRTSHFHTIGYFREDAVRLIRMFAMHTKKDGLFFPPVEVERVVSFSIFG